MRPVLDMESYSESRYTVAMLVPYSLLSPTALRSVVEEFVTRDGTDNSAVEPRIDSVVKQLASGRLELHFDDDTASCNIITGEHR
jgi:uncharacterized protein